jgi:DNA-binding XRE family transcriptional regulator
MVTVEQVREARVRAGTGEQIVVIARDLGADYGPLYLAVRGVTFKALTEPAPVVTPPGAVSISQERAAGIVELYREGFNLNELSWLTGLSSSAIRGLYRKQAASRAEPAAIHGHRVTVVEGAGGGPRGAGRAEAARWTAVLCAARAAEEYPKQQFAQTVGVTEAAVNNWIGGRRVPTLPVMVTAGRALGLRLTITGLGQGRNTHAQGAVTAPDGTWEQSEIRRLEESLRGKRHRRGATQEDLAPFVGVSEWSLKQFEKGSIHPRPAVLAAWAAALGCRVRWRAMT